MRLSKKPKVVLDTNVFLSAFLFGGYCKLVLELYEKKFYQSFISQALKIEIIDKLEHKFLVSKEYLTDVESYLNSFEYIHTLVHSIHSKLLRDKKDSFLIDLIETVNADYLVTGDKDLLVFNEWKNTKVIKPRNFIHELFS